MVVLNQQMLWSELTSLVNGWFVVDLAIWAYDNASPSNWILLYVGNVCAENLFTKYLLVGIWKE